MSHVIGIDIGTSGIKIGAMDEQGHLAFVLHTSYSLSCPQNGWVEIDPREVWTKTHVLLTQVIERLASTSARVDAISLSTFCNAMILMDEHGQALSPGIVYLDRRSEQEVAAMKHIIGEEVQHRTTGNRIEPGMISVTSLLWLKKQQADLFSRMYKWGHLSTYILHQLTGRFALDWTQASYTGIFDITKYEWLSEHCRLLGIPESSLPDIVAPAEVVGTLSHSQLTSLLGDIPVVAGAADTACSAFAIGLESGEVFESVGTSDVLTVCRDQPTGFDNRFLNRCHVLRNQWLSHGAMSTPGACIQWFCRTFLENGQNIAETLESLTEKSTLTPGANGVFFLPYLHGERTPIWDVHAKGVFAGISLNTSKVDMLQSIYEGCAFGLRQIYDIIQNEYNLHPMRLRAVGGGARNREWMQIKAHVLNVPVDIMHVTETAVYGACLLAAKGAGYSESLWSALSLKQGVTLDTYYPAPDTAAAYTGLYQVFSQLYPALQGLFKANAQVQEWLHENNATSGDIGEVCLADL